MQINKKDTKDKGNKILFIRHEVFYIAILAISVLLSYYNSVNGPFYYDDFDNIVAHPPVHAREFSINELIVKPASRRARPIPMISFALNFYFGQLNPFGYHIVNIAIHLISVIILFYLLRITLIVADREKRYKEEEYSMFAFWAALLWALSPLHTNSVTYIVQRMNLFTTLFSLLAMLLYVKGRWISLFSGDLKSRRASLLPLLFYILSLLAWFFALLSKQNAVLLPFMILIYEWFFFADLRINRKKIPILLSFLLLLCSFFVFLSYLWYNLSPIDAVLSTYQNKDFTVMERLYTEMRVIWVYLSLIYLPLASKMHLVYNFAISASLFNPWTTFTSFLGIIAVIILLFKIVKTQRVLSFSVLWFFIMIFMESSFVGVEVIYEHKTYMPSAFLFLPLVLFLFQYFSKQRVACILLFIYAAYFSYLTIQRNDIWSDPVAFWGDNYKKSPGEKRVMLNYANALHLAARNSEALVIYRKLIDMEPEFALAYGNYGEVLAAEHRYGEAEMQLRKAIELDGKYTAAYSALGAVCQKQGKLSEAMTYYLIAGKNQHDNPIIIANIASLYRDLKDWQKAEAMYKRALALSPEMLRATLDLGLIYMKEKKYPEASKVYHDALNYYPKNAEIYYRLGLISIEQKDYSTAVLYLQNALILNPNLSGIRKTIAEVNSLSGHAESAENAYKDIIEHDPYDYNAYNNLGLMLLKKGDIFTAEKHFMQALRLKPDFAAALKNMGNIMFIRKDYDQAAHYYQNALKVTPRDPVLYHNLGSVYAFKQDYEKARSCYTKALEIKPDYYEAQQNLQKVINK